MEKPKARTRVSSRPFTVFGLLILVPVTLLLALGLHTWRTAWERAQTELDTTADAVGQYVLRILEGHRVVGERVNDILADLSNDDIRAQEARVHAKLAQVLTESPLTQTIVILDRDGDILSSANVFPVPRHVTARDREWVLALKSDRGPRLHVSKVHRGRLDNYLFFGASLRRYVNPSGKAGPYAGVINLSVNPNDVAAGLPELLASAGDGVTIVRADGEILVRKPGFDAPLPPLSRDRNAAFFELVASGQGRGSYSVAYMDGHPRLVATRKIKNLEVFAQVSRRHDAVVSAWWASFRPQVGIGVPCIALSLLAMMLAYRKSTEIRVAQEAARFAAVFDASPVGMAVARSEDGTLIAINQSMATLVRRPARLAETAGLPLAQLFDDTDAGAVLTAIRQARDRGVGGPARVMLRPSVLGDPVAAQVVTSQMPGDPEAVVLVAEDIRRVIAEEQRQELILREVEHRARNTLSIVQAAIRMGGKTALDVGELVSSLEARVSSIARAQSLLARGEVAGVDLEELVRDEVMPFATHATVVTNGPSLRARGPCAQALTLAIHELATNALKYGALREVGGRVNVTWSLTDNDIVLQWEEHCSQPVSKPTRKGFGSRLLTATIEMELEGKIVQSWAEHGLTASLQIPHRWFMQGPHTVRLLRPAHEPPSPLTGTKPSDPGSA